MDRGCPPEESWHNAMNIAVCSSQYLYSLALHPIAMCAVRLTAKNAKMGDAYNIENWKENSLPPIARLGK